MIGTRFRVTRTAPVPPRPSAKTIANAPIAATPAFPKNQDRPRYAGSLARRPLCPDSLTVAGTRSLVRPSAARDRGRSARAGVFPAGSVDGAELMPPVPARLAPSTGTELIAELVSRVGTAPVLERSLSMAEVPGARAAGAVGGSTARFSVEPAARDGVAGVGGTATADSAALLGTGSGVATGGAGATGAAAAGGGAGAGEAGAGGAGGAAAAGGGVGAGTGSGAGAGGAAGAGGELGAPRGGSKDRGSTYVSSFPTRTPRWTYGSECSGSPDGPAAAITSPSATCAPFLTCNGPR